VSRPKAAPDKLMDEFRRRDNSLKRERDRT
jgi:hypothetical protein